MRTFRGRREYPKEWVYGYLIGDDVIVGNIVEFNDEYFNTSFWYKVDPATVGQFSGIPVKHGKEIFEGDIIVGERESHWHGGKDKVKAVVEFSEETLSFVADGPLFNIENIEVIGNIHEHPKLLEREGRK